MKNYSQFLQDLSLLISAESVEAEPTIDAPYGLGVKKAYSAFISVAERFGLKVIDYDGYIGEIRLGKGDEACKDALGVIGHLDVVPAGDLSKWKTSPYALTIKDGVLYGRGVTDDKGPMLLVLYAIKELLDEGVMFNRQLRFFIGLNEETGWKDVERYRQIGTFPIEGFSPDGNFPVTYAEKGPNAVTFRFAYNGAFSGFEGGVVVNAVCDHAIAVGKVDDELIKKHGLTVKDGVIESNGKSAHGSKPELGKNAILPLLKYIDEVENGTVTPLIKYLFNDELGIFKIGNETGNATLSPNLLSFENGEIVLTCDFRVPAKMNLKDFVPLFDKMGIKYSVKKSRDPHYVDDKSDLVQGLLSAYNTVMQTNDLPYSCSGATFASVFEKGVAFGPEFEGGDGAIHEPNEYMTEKDLLKMFEIYKQALKNLLV